PRRGVRYHGARSRSTRLSSLSSVGTRRVARCWSTRRFPLRSSPGSARAISCSCCAASYLPAWQFGLALTLPSLGGLVGSWLAPRVSRRLGGHRTLVTSGLLRDLPLFALPFLPEGVRSEEHTSELQSRFDLVC